MGQMKRPSVLWVTYCNMGQTARYVSQDTHAMGHRTHRGRLWVARCRMGHTVQHELCDSESVGAVNTHGFV